MSQLAKIITEQRATILEEWIAAVEAKLAPKDVSWAESRDHVPELLDEMVEDLWIASGQDSGRPPCPRAQARQHGRQRSSVGFDVHTVVDEFATLHDIILERAEREKIRLEARDVRALARLMSTSVRDSADAFMRDRQAYDERIAKESRRTQEQLTLATRVSKLGFFDLDVGKDTLELNQQMQEDWRLPSPATVQMALDRLHEEDRERVATELNASLYEGAVYRTEYRVVRADGTTIWVEARGTTTYDADGKPVRFFGTARDVSDVVGLRKWLEVVLNELPTPLVMVAPNTGAHLFSNRAADAMYGRTLPKHTTSEIIAEDYHVTDAKGHRLTADEIPTTRAARGEVLEHEEFVWHTQHGEIDIVISSRYLPAMYGQDALVICPFQDVTALKTTQRKLQELVKNLEEESAMRDRFVSALSHDLRTPLAAANLSAQSIIRHTQSPEKLERAALRITTSLSRAEKMIQDILDANRIKAGEPLQVHPQEVQLDELLKEAVSDLQQLHGKRVVLKDAPTGIAGDYDPSALQRVVDNLVNNAVKYGDETAPIELSLTCKNGEAAISVHNEGPPITAKDQKTLFEPYYRAESAQRGKHRGWGIGLTLVREISQAHGGSVDVRSNAKSGTTFTVRLPVASDGPRVNN